MASRDLRRKAALYVLVGGAAALVDLLTFRWLEIFIQSVLLAAACSFSIAAVVNYSLSSMIVYRTAIGSPRRAGMFLIFACVGLIVNASTTAILATHAQLTPTLAKVGGIGLAFGLNFLLNTFVVFRR